MTVEATAGSADDGALAYTINPQDLQTFTNISTFSAKWYDGRNLFSSINGSSEDHTAQIIGNVVKSAVKILPLLSGTPNLAPPGTKPTPINCTASAVSNLQVAKNAKAVLDVANTDLETASKALLALTTKVAALGSNVDPRTKSNLSEKYKAVVDAQIRQTDAAAALEKALKPITYTRKFLWPESGSTFGHGPEALPMEKLATWIEPQNGELPKGPVVYLQIERAGSFGRLPPRPDLTPPPAQTAPTTEASSPNPTKPELGDKNEAQPSAKVKGLRYRMPAMGRLVACTRSPCGSLDSDSVLATFENPIAQLGYINVLPFKTRTFGTNSFGAEMAMDGSLKSTTYEQKAAPAEGATAALSDAVGSLSAALDPTVKLQSQTAYLKALKDQRDAAEALQTAAIDPTVTERASLDVDTALLNSKVANLQAKIALQTLLESQSK